MDNLNLLFVFEALWKERSVTLAAQSLGVTQSAASSGLRRLRTYYGDDLFMQVGKRMEPTPLALAISETLLTSLSSIRATRSAVPNFDPATAVREFSLRVRDIGEAVVLPPLYSLFRMAAPSATLQTRFTAIDDVPLSLAAGRIDLAVGHLPQLSGEIHRKLLFSQTYICLVRAGHPIAKERLTPELFAAQEHLLVTYSGSEHVALERELSRLGAKQRIKIKMPQYLATPYLLGSSDLLITVPDHLAAMLVRHHHLVTMPFPLNLKPFEISMYWHHRYHKDPANGWFRELIKAAASGISANGLAVPPTLTSEPQ